LRLARILGGLVVSVAQRLLQRRFELGDVKVFDLKAKLDNCRLAGLPHFSQLADSPDWETNRITSKSKPQSAQ